MTKKRNTPKTDTSFSSMGRVLFYIIAIIVACCAVAVVLFETDAGLELVAKIRGENLDEPAVKTGKTKSASTGEHTESGKETKTKQESASEKNTESRAKDTSSNSNIAEQLNKEQTEKATKDEPKNENVGQHEEKKDENIEKETIIHERTKGGEPTETTVSGEDSELDSEDGNELWETIDKELGEEDQLDDDMAQQPGNEYSEENEEERETGEESTEEVRETGEESLEEERETVEESLEEEKETGEESLEEERETVEDRVDKEEGVSEPAEEDEDVSVGDSLVEIEKETRFVNKEQKEKKKYETIEPEGPPIDEYPRHAQRGLRGDYGGKDCKDYDRNCKPWADIGECTKNPIWMEVNCKKSCDVCGCSDNHVKCSEWAKQYECTKNSDYMNKNCMKSCGRC